MPSPRLISIAIFSLAALLLPCAAFADGVAWTLDGVSLNDGGSVTGSFVYDASTNAYSSPDVITTSGALFSGTEYTSLSNMYFSNTTLLGLGLNPANTVDFTDETFLQLFFTSPLTNAGGTDPLFAMETICTNSTCSSPITRQSVVGSVTTIPAPEPSTLLLLLSSFLLLAFLRRLL